MNQDARILTEQDPILREIWAMGYTCVEKDDCRDVLKLIDSGKRYVKTLEKCDFMKVVSTLNFINSVLLDGSDYRWIKEADGSAQRFRQLIAPETKRT